MTLRVEGNVGQRRTVFEIFLDVAWRDSCVMG